MDLDVEGGIKCPHLSTGLTVVCRLLCTHRVLESFARRGIGMRRSRILRASGRRVNCDRWTFCAGMLVLLRRANGSKEQVVHEVVLAKGCAGGLCAMVALGSGLTAD